MKKLAAVDWRRRSESSNAPGDTKMDMSKYLGSAFLKVGDIKAGPIRSVIADITEGKYGKPDVSFSDGTKLSLNTTNDKILCQAYGTESDDWIGKEIELSLGEIEQPRRPELPARQAARGDPGQANLAADRKESAAETQERLRRRYERRAVKRSERRALHPPLVSDRWRSVPCISTASHTTPRALLST